ncbi:MAG: GIY-YIG nuclease family protein [Candidatus Absconditabacteria bacterium]|nr:GIY-YIG nuclease family protein [Candidatus Absconditabacteria bacterium]
MNTYYVYILTNRKKGTLYVGVTNNLVRRSFEHKSGFNEGFTKKYEIKYLVYYEIINSIEQAIIREKQIKHWNREWKVRLIEKTNPQREDLFDNIIE